MSSERPTAVASPSTKPRVSVAERRRRKRELLLDAAQEVLATSGAHKLSLRAVARRANLAPASLYEYFDGREALLAALAERPRAVLNDYLAAARADSSGMATDLLVRMGLAYVRFARRHPDAFRLMFEVAPGNDAPSPEATRVSRPALGPLRDAARAGQLTGEIDADDDPDRIAWGLCALAHGLATLHTAKATPPAPGADDDDISALRAYVRGWTT